jgi:hypothetical protein
MNFQTSSSRRQFLSTVAKTAGAAIMLRPGLGWAADSPDVRVAEIRYESFADPLIRSALYSDRKWTLSFFQYPVVGVRSN